MTTSDHRWISQYGRFVSGISAGSDPGAAEAVACSMAARVALAERVKQHEAADALLETAGRLAGGLRGRGPTRR